MSYSTLLFDFDGVLVDSNRIRLKGFIELYQREHPQRMPAWREFLRANPGLSRYDKIRHFHHGILGTGINEAGVRQDARRYSAIVRDRVTAASAMEGSLAFLLRFRQAFTFALISASDGDELRSICEARRIDGFFTEILGSPTQKSDNIARLVAARGWDPQTTLYIGDSHHDRIAARDAGVAFLGFGVTARFDDECASVTGFAELTRRADAWVAARRAGACTGYDTTT